MATAALASPAERIAERLEQADLTDAERRELVGMVAHFRDQWRFWARPNQVAPPGDWTIWAFVAGRGAGKTRSGAEWIIERCRAYAAAGAEHRGALIGRTAADVRDVMVEGESGLMACLDRAKVKAKYEPGRRRVVIPSLSSEIHTYSAMEPDSLRGPQHHTAWGDEPAAWRQTVDDKGNTAWSNAMLGLRLDAPGPGLSPRAMATTTPKAIPLVREWFNATTPCARPAGHDGGHGPAAPDEVVPTAAQCRYVDTSVVMTGGALYDNVAHLAQAFVGFIVDRYRHSPLWQQEILGKLILAVEGALWQPQRITHVAAVPALSHVIVAVDPPAKFVAECGIIVIGVEAAPVTPGLPRLFVLDDMSMRGQAEAWGAQCLAAARRYGADTIVAEDNQGGDMVRAVIELQDTDGEVFVDTVRAKVSKWQRAEPVAAAYSRVAHLGYFAELEDQMTTWTEDDAYSPDRMDALVHGVRYLLPEMTTMPLVSKTAADLVVPDILGGRRS